MQFTSPLLEEEEAPRIYFTDDISEQIRHYETWLSVDARQESNHEEINKYIDAASRTITVRGREVSLFAPFRGQYSALRTLTRKQGFALSAVGLAGVLGLLFYGMRMVVVTIAVITALYLSDLLVNVILSVRMLNLSAEEQFEDIIVNALVDADWPKYTILCPLYREAEVVPQFVQAMQALDYPTDKLQILFLTEEDDVETREAIQEMDLPPHFTIVTVPVGQPRTKPRACNYGLLQATGDYIVIYDAEDVPESLQLKKAILTFANQGPETACVQARLNFYNPEQNLLTRWFTAEYSLWFDLTLPGLQKLGLPLPLGGTSNHFRAPLLRELGGWDAFNVTEDCDLGLRMARYGLKTAMLNSTTYEEANSQVKNWIRQRSRWIKGYMQTYLVYMRQPQIYLRRGHIKEFLSLQLFVGGKTAVLLVNPFMWALLVAYIVFHPIQLYHTLFPAPVLYMGAMCLIFGNFFYTYAHLIGCMKRGHYRLVKWTLFIPIYWAMASLAAFMALQQLIFKPHYWEKTQHGLHLRIAGSSSRITSIAEEPEKVELVSTSSSASISWTTDEFELELTGNTVRLKMRTTASLPAVRPAAPSRPEEADGEEDTLRLPAYKVLKPLPTTPQPEEFDEETDGEEDTLQMPAYKVLKPLPTTPRPQDLKAKTVTRVEMPESDPAEVLSTILAPEVETSEER